MSHLQTIIFDKKYFTKTKANNWIIKHNYKNTKIDIKENTYHFRQRTPGNGRYFSKKISPGITFVFEI